MGQYLMESSLATDKNHSQSASAILRPTLSKLNVRTSASDLTWGYFVLLDYCEVRSGLVWSPVEDEKIEKSNERAETAICPQEMVAHWKQ